MDYSQAKLGRVFVVRLYQDEAIPDCLEELARKEGIRAALVTIVGGIEGGRIVVGPKDHRTPPEPMTTEVKGRHEVLGAGFIFMTDGKPVLHLHAAFGRERNTLVGCTRTGVRAYCVIEAVVTELLDCTAERMLDPETGWFLLTP